MSDTAPVALFVTTLAEPSQLGPYLETGASGSMGARSFRDLPEVWAIEGAPGTYLIEMNTDGTTSLIASAQVAGRSYSHAQLNADTVWTIDHGLGARPGGILAKDSEGSIIEFDDAIYDDDNTVRLIFFYAVSGTAELS